MRRSHGRGCGGGKSPAADGIPGVHFEDEGVAPYIDSHTNQQFVVLSRRQLEYLEKNYIFQYWQKIDEDYTLVRVCTSWSTTREEVDALVSNIERI